MNGRTARVDASYTLGAIIDHDAAACRVSIRRCDLCFAKGYRWWRGGKPRTHPVGAPLSGVVIGLVLSWPLITVLRSLGL